MKRKDFIRLTGLAGSVYATSSIINGSRMYGGPSTKDISAADVLEFLVSLIQLGPNTVDRFFIGDPDWPVSSFGIGTGCICDPMYFADLEPDMFMAIDDVVRTWTQTAFATDSGRPLIVINHGTSEETGMRMLNQIIKERFPEIETIHFKQGCSYKWITG